MRTTILFLVLAALPVAAADTATLTGTVIDLWESPVVGADVSLFLSREVEGEEEEEREHIPGPYERPWLFEDEPLYRATTDAEGVYRLEDIRPGRYDARCSQDHYEWAFALDLDLAAGDEMRHDFTLEPLTEVEKPNLYLYPEAETEVTVRLGFPAGGGVTISEPTYGDGWTVEIAPDGTIAGGYGHLFYEAQVPKGWQFERGWVVQKRQLEDFFKENLAAWGFNERETADFIDYWIPRLGDKAFYVIYPQRARDIEPLISLDIQPPPDSILRLYYVISGVDRVDRYVPEPEIPSFHRYGFTACEWGVVLVGDEIVH